MVTPRPRSVDVFGLGRALPGLLLPLLVAAMVFLAALAAASGLAASGLASHWHTGETGTLSIQVPDPSARAANGSGTRAQAVAALLGAKARQLTETEIVRLLRPWLGGNAEHLAFALPAVFTSNASLPENIAARLSEVAPGTIVASGSIWQERLTGLAASLEGCADLALLLVALTAAAVISVATGAGVAARRDAIEILHGLGAADGMIAGRFAVRVVLLALAGAIIGVLAAVPVLLGLARVIATFQPGASLAPVPAGMAAALGMLPRSLWLTLGTLPIAACGIAWATAQATARSWLGRLP